jgi:hypothetical protein
MDLSHFIPLSGSDNVWLLGTVPRITYGASLVNALHIMNKYNNPSFATMF